MSNQALCSANGYLVRTVSVPGFQSLELACNTAIRSTSTFNEERFDSLITSISKLWKENGSYRCKSKHLYYSIARGLRTHVPFTV